MRARGNIFTNSGLVFHVIHASRHRSPTSNSSQFCVFCFFLIVPSDRLRFLAAPVLGSCGRFDVTLSMHHSSFAFIVMFISRFAAYVCQSFLGCHFWRSGPNNVGGLFRHNLTIAPQKRDRNWVRDNIGEKRTP